MADDRTRDADVSNRKAVEVADMMTPDPPRVIIPAGDWEKFEGWMQRPARDIPALRKLALIRGRPKE